MLPLPLRLFCPMAMLSLACCASRPAPAPLAAAPPVPILASAPMPAGGHPGMAIPALLADGGYDTPNRNLSPAATIWHLRAGLNFAAIGCRGVQGDAIVARYNMLLRGHKAVLRQAELALQSEYRASGDPAWRKAYDDAMTRLYNYYALAPARASLCATVAPMLNEAVTVAPEQFGDFAATRLPELDRSFTDFFAAYDAWRTQRPAYGPIIAIAANTGARAPPRIEVDPAIFRMP